MTNEYIEITTFSGITKMMRKSKVLYLAEEVKKNLEMTPKTSTYYNLRVKEYEHWQKLAEKARG